MLFEGKRGGSNISHGRLALITVMLQKRFTNDKGVNDKPVTGHKRGVHKYSLHENSSEIDQEKQNKTRVQRKNSD